MSNYCPIHPRVLLIPVVDEDNLVTLRCALCDMASAQSEHQLKEG